MPQFVHKRIGIDLVARKMTQKDYKVLEALSGIRILFPKLYLVSDHRVIGSGSRSATHHTSRKPSQTVVLVFSLFIGPPITVGLLGV
jgi:hypothetical protein